MNNEGLIGLSCWQDAHLSIRDLIKPRNFTCVAEVPRGISTVSPRWTAEFAKINGGKPWALDMSLPFTKQRIMTVVKSNDFVYSKIAKEC